jgi:hypothetical protein
MEPGKLYLIRGGHVIRFIGQSMGVGSDDVLREITDQDARMLRVRLVALRARKMAREAAWIREVMDEVGVTPPTIPERFTKHWSP